MDMDREYQNGAFIAGSEAMPATWAQKAAAFRTGLGSRARLGLPYGPADRQSFDLFLPEGLPQGLLVFVHGGYWLATHRDLWSHLAAGAVARGWACALPSYTLAPQARIAQITAEISQAIATAAAEVPGPLVVSGHSAGGHLAARMGCADVKLPRLARVVPISPLADLEPLLATQMNADLRLDAAEVALESPALLPRHPHIQAHVWVGGDERPAFLWQARTLAERWACGWTVDPGRHHLDVIDGLEQADSPLLRACLDGL